VERFFDGLALCAFLAVGLWLLPVGAARPDWLLFVAMFAGFAFIAAVVAGWVLALRPGPFLGLAERMLWLMPARLRLRVLELLTSFVTGFCSLKHPSTVVPVAGLSIGAWMLEAGMYYVLLRGFNLALGPIAALIGAAAANLGTMIPSSPGYVGTFDVPLQQVLTGVFGVAPELATSYTLVVHAALIVPIVALGLLFLASMDLSLRQVSQSASLKIPEERSLVTRPAGATRRAFGNDSV
jgi:uncharacterized membrane protein YbhN (UPF0104 family)